MVERQVVALDVPVQLRPVTPGVLGNGCPAACKAVAVRAALGVRIPPHPPCPRSAADSATVSEAVGGEFDSRRGYARRNPTRRKPTVPCPSGEGAVCKTVYAGSSPAGASMPSTVDLPGRAGRPVAFHTGDTPGSTPGLGTGPQLWLRRHRRCSYSCGRTARCEGSEFFPNHPTLGVAQR